MADEGPFADDPTEEEPPSARFARGELLGHLRIMRLIGRGGMGEVYLARDTKLGRRVALKVIKPALAASVRALQRFLREARLTAKLNHPNVVTIHAVGEYRGVPYVALEYIAGQSLRERLIEARQEPRPVGRPPGSLGELETARIGIAIADALTHAHENEVVHLDLKPDNVLIGGDGRIRVVDFGLAKVVREGLADEKRRGTPFYMAPEQWLRQAPSPRTDVWALGVTLFRLLAGRRPFDSPHLPTLQKQICEQAAPLDEIADAPHLLRELISSCLRKKPQERPAAEEVAARLRELVANLRPQRLGEQSPFRGLLPFHERHAHLFFGRDPEVERFVERLRTEPVLPVVGASGAGKSSFVQAGVIPRLRERGRWVVVGVRPGGQPFHALAAKLVATGEAPSRGSHAPSPSLSSTGASQSSLEISGSQVVEGIDRVSDLASKLAESPRELVVQLLTLAETKQAQVLLYVDQLEELFTLCRSEDTQRDFLSAMIGAADDALDPVRVIFTVRDDFLGRIATSSAVRAALRAVTVIHNPDVAALREILTRPLEAVGYRYDDPSLVDAMLQSSGEGPANLPLLEFAAQMLWDHRDRDRRVLLRSAYDSMGGVAGALTRHADAVLEGLAPSELALAREMLLRMVTPEGTRKVVGYADVLDGLGRQSDDAAAEDSGPQPRALAVLARLTEARLVAVTKARAGRRSVTAELTHESLVGSWRTLKRWREEAQDDLLLREDLAQAARYWERRGRLDHDLWRGAALRDGLTMWRRATVEVPAAFAEFLKEGDRVERRRKFRRMALRFGITALSLTVALVAMVVAWVIADKESEAQRQRQRAEEERGQALLAAAQGAAEQQKFLEARGRVRLALQARDSLSGRAQWWRLEREALVWTLSSDAAAYEVRFSPDGRHLATADQRGGISLIDRSTRAVTPLAGPTSEQSLSVAFSPDGRFVAASSWGGGIALWDLSTKQLSHSFQAHSGAAVALAFQPHGSLIASGGVDHEVKFWEAASGRLHKTLLGHEATIRTAEFSPDGSLLATGSVDGTVRLWDVAAGAPLRVLEHGPMATVRGLAFSPDGRKLVSGGLDGRLVSWEVSSGNRLAELSGPPVLRLAFHPNGEVVAAAGADGGVRQWELKSGSLLRHFRRHGEAVTGVDFSPDGKLLASASLDNTVRLWRSDAKVPPTPLGGHASSVVDVAMQPQGTRLASAGADGTIRIWDVSSGRPIRVLRGHRRAVTAVRFSPDGRLLATGSFDAQVRIWDAGDWSARRILVGHHAAVRALSFSPEGSVIASASVDKTVRLWDVASGLERQVLSGHVDHVFDAAFSADGSQLATAGRDGLKLWDPRTGRSLTPPEGFEQSLMGVSYAMSGSRLAVTGPGGLLRVIESKSGEELMRYRGGGRLYRAQFMGDGQRLAVPSSDGTARVIQSSDGQQLSRCRGHAGEVNALTMTVDGLEIATAGDDGTVRLWHGADCRPMWRAPLLLGGPPRLLTHRGWTDLAKKVPLSKSPLGANLSKSLAAEGLRATLAGDALCMKTHAGGLQLWSVADDRLQSKPSLSGLRKVLSYGKGCVAIDDEAVYRILPDGLRQRRLDGRLRALTMSGEQVVVATEKSVLAFDAEGLQDKLWEESLRTQPSALLAAGGGVLVGLANGRVLRFEPRSGRPPKELPLQRQPASSVSAMALGPADTLVVGYHNGVVGVWDPRAGQLVHQARLHGPVIHLLVEDARVVAATSLGDHVTWDLSSLERPYCELIVAVWARVDTVWADGRAQLVEPPAGHACAP